MSSIRLFILGSLDERGPMHGHQLRLLAQEEHIHKWTDFTVGAIYGAIKRLAAEGLIDGVRSEREGNYPERVVYAISDAGRVSLGVIRLETLREIVLRPDPFDLALARLDGEKLDELPATLGARRDVLEARLRESRAHLENIRRYLTVAETLANEHGLMRLEAELAWLDTVIESLPAIVADETARTTARKAQQQ
ncbi:PadR family transcriptional regulator [Compostimonas suwonensis]|uniref:DNA-binding PadR family transcriptional regulator n=1 Tax=Compostimonas suwonensis TaxID=1048394 RepID=A0A2M9BUS0_9MICO|nr:PadR family transcriptional regulator [Compostimonas suwonensis]PJJ61642.1 DNA-binding PadR family transcriptional regulator [Compostimonas suwonensis]